MEGIISRIGRERDNTIQLNVFPKTALPGYFVGSGYHETAPGVQLTGNLTLDSGNRFHPGTHKEHCYCSECPGLRMRLVPAPPSPRKIGKGRR